MSSGGGGLGGDTWFKSYVLEGGPLRSSHPPLFVVLISRCRSSSCFRRDIWEVRARVRYPEAASELWEQPSCGSGKPPPLGIVTQMGRGPRVPRAHAWVPSPQGGAAGPPALEPGFREPFLEGTPCRPEATSSGQRAWGSSHPDRTWQLA